MQTLKYALNHPWHFKSLWLTCFISCLQIFVVFYFECVKFYVFYKSAKLWDLLQYFTVLAVIANIDDFLYRTIQEKNSKEFIREKYNERNACDPDEGSEVIIDDDIEDEAERERVAEVKRRNEQLEPMVLFPIQVTTSWQARHVLNENKLTL